MSVRVVARGAGICPGGRSEEPLSGPIGMTVADFRERLREAIANEIAMERYGDEVRAAAEEELVGLEPKDVATIVEAMVRYPNVEVLEIVRVVRERAEAVRVATKSEGD